MPRVGHIEHRDGNYELHNGARSGSERLYGGPAPFGSTTDIDHRSTMYESAAIATWKAPPPEAIRAAFQYDQWHTHGFAQPHGMYGNASGPPPSRPSSGVVNPDTVHHRGPLGGADAEVYLVHRRGQIPSTPASLHGGAERDQRDPRAVPWGAPFVPPHHQPGAHLTPIAPQLVDGHLMAPTALAPEKLPAAGRKATVPEAPGNWWNHS